MVLPVFLETHGPLRIYIFTVDSDMSRGKVSLGKTVVQVKRCMAEVSKL